MKRKMLTAIETNLFILFSKIFMVWKKCSKLILAQVRKGRLSNIPPIRGLLQFYVILLVSTHPASSKGPIYLYYSIHLVTHELIE